MMKVFPSLSCSSKSEQDLVGGNGDKNLLKAQVDVFVVGTLSFFKYSLINFNTLPSLFIYIL